MKTQRQNGEATISFTPEGYNIIIPREYCKEKDEFINVFRHSKYLIEINQSRPVRLCQIPDLKHERIAVLSLEEARPLLKYLNDLDDNFFGKILYQHDNAWNFTPIIILDFDEIIKSAGKSVKSIKDEVLNTVAHEFRHAEQYQKCLFHFPRKAFWRFIEYYRNARESLFKKYKSLIYIYPFSGAIIGISIVLSIWKNPLFSIPIILFILDLVLMSRICESPSEKDAQNFAQEAVKDKRWRKCVKVVKEPR